MKTGRTLRALICHETSGARVEMIAIPRVNNCNQKLKGKRINIDKCRTTASGRSHCFKLEPL
jgi:hypothetical protein